MLQISGDYIEDGQACYMDRFIEIITFDGIRDFLCDLHTIFLLFIESLAMRPFEPHL